MKKRLGLVVVGVAANPQPGIFKGGSLWSPDHLHSEILVTPTGGGRLSRLKVGTYPSSLARVGDQVWVTNYGDGTLSVVDR